MSGDFGPRVVIPAALQSLKQFPDLSLVLIGTTRELNQSLSDRHERLRVQYANSILLPDTRPSEALRRKRDTSLGLSIGLVADGEVEGCVSAANAGALMGLGKSQLGIFDGIDRPAICAAMPAGERSYFMLDLGANVDCTAQQLFQFAVMASALAEVVSGKSRPGIGLLNIGSEAIKGNRLVLETADLLQSATDSALLNYCGFIEGDQLFNHSLDVVVCDGFAGNIALKTAEGTARFVTEGLREEFSQSLVSRLRGLVAKATLKQWLSRYNPARLNGASLLGLPKVVIKSHGSADVFAYKAAIAACYYQIKHQVPERIEQRLKNYSVS